MVTGHCPLKKLLSILGITDSPLFRACMETDVTPKHVMHQYNGVAERRAGHLGSSATLQEALGDLCGLLSFWSELSWLERSNGEIRINGTRITDGSGQPSKETGPGKERKKEKKYIFGCNFMICRYTLQ
ncbi:jg11462 [Pararge aegeria aegeria]|uniref:Jg11462 protein n=1 Tax=Pararge aegeria aegeria TaxID=348720 RepID=A0A8S4RZX9_9NEOP|nr:jg11462 [Pararge aegeria aegeria]